jgi:hypothetical protein
MNKIVVVVALLFVQQRFIHRSEHINPSAETLTILSPDMKVIAQLDGWELVTLPNETVVYHRSQIHFAPTHSLEIAVYDPVRRKDKLIYPLMPIQPVRRAFIEKVAAVYKQRGEAWFREHNHHGDPTKFDSALVGNVTVDTAAKSFSFKVRFGDPENVADPLPFTEDVKVTCGPLAPADQIQCKEVPAR